MNTNDLELAELLPWIIAAVVVIAIVLIVIAVMKRRKRQERSDRLRERFGPEYDRTVERADSRSEGEDQLEARAERRERIRLRSLSPDQRRSFVARWEDLQASFVDGPASAVRGADVLLDDVALARGYPDASAEQRLDDLAMDHSDEVHEYRHANLGEKDDRGDDRGALLAARRLFEALIGPEHETLGERGPDAPFDSERTMSGREPHDEDTRALDSSRSRDEETSRSRGDETSRSRGDESSRSRDEETSRSRNEETSRSRGDESSRSRGDESSRSRGDESSRSRGDESSRSRGDESSRSRDEATRDVSRGEDTSGGGSTRADDLVEPDRAERTEPLTDDRRQAEGDDTSLRDRPPRTEERTIEPPESR